MDINANTNLVGGTHGNTPLYVAGTNIVLTLGAGWTKGMFVYAIAADGASFTVVAGTATLDVPPGTAASSSSALAGIVALECFADGKLRAAQPAVAAAATAPGAPTALVLGTATATSQPITWTAPASNGGSALTGYRVGVRLSGSNGAYTYTDTGSTVTGSVVADLTASTAYQYVVEATNAIGNSADSAPVIGATAATVPGAPTGLTLGTATSTTQPLTWSAPASNGGASITSYLVGYRLSGSTGAYTDIDTGSAATGYVVTVLAPNTAYQFVVNAVNVAGPGADSVPTTGSTAAAAILVATFSDSRGSIGAPGPDVYAGPLTSPSVSLTGGGTFNALSLFRPDAVLTVDGGVSGESSSGWDSPTRSAGRTITAIKALPWNVIFVQYGTNDYQNQVNSLATAASTAASVAANIKALVTELLTTGRKVVLTPTFGRTAAGWGNTFVAEKTQATDWGNYGDGASIVGIVPWAQAHGLYNSQLYVLDLQSTINVGGVSTGALADPLWLGDNVHASMYLRRVAGKKAGALLDTIFPRPATLPALYRSTGPNLIPDVSAAYRNAGVSNCVASAVTYSTDAKGRKFGEVVVTPNGTAGFYMMELLADIGTNGGRTPAGGSAAILAVGDKVKPAVLLSLHDGAGNPSVVNNVGMAVYAQYVGGTPATQTVTNNPLLQGTSTFADADNDALYEVPPFVLTGDSSNIGAPAAGAGLRMFFRFYFGAVTTPFTLRWTNPQMYKVI